MGYTRWMVYDGTSNQNGWVTEKDEFGIAILNDQMGRSKEGLMIIGSIRRHLFWWSSLEGSQDTLLPTVMATDIWTNPYLLRKKTVRNLDCKTHLWMENNSISRHSLQVPRTQSGFSSLENVPVNGCTPTSNIFKLL